LFLTSTVASVKGECEDGGVTRGYGQYCGLARALELVGSRWTLLIVRELLAGPKRYTELAQGLPGIPSNILSSRLREMEDGGIVERTLEPRPSTSVVYTLTAYGQELEGPMTALGRWGVKSLAPPTGDATYSSSALALALKSVFDTEPAGDRRLVADIRLGDQRLHVVVGDGSVCFPRQPPADPDFVVTATPAVFSELLAGNLDISAALDTGAATVDGSRREAHRFFKIFHMSRPAPSEPGGAT
jgi:DNA-binding HxlR family transcriptional regulator/putative sterol carrier protein